MHSIRLLRLYMSSSSGSRLLSLLTIKIQSLTINSRKSCIYPNAVGGWENIQLFQSYSFKALFKRMLIGTLCISVTSVRINIPFRLLLSFYYNARLRIITLPL